MWTIRPRRTSPRRDRRVEADFRVVDPSWRGRAGDEGEALQMPLTVMASASDNCPPSLRARAKRGRSNPEAARQHGTPAAHPVRHCPPGLLRPLRGLAMTVGMG